METWIIIFIIFAILICVFAMIYVAKEFAYDAADRRRERAAAKNAENNTDKNALIKPIATDCAIVPKGMMLLPVDYAVKSEVSATQTEPAPVKETTREIDENALVISRSESKTVDESYAELTKEQKKFFDGLLSYALSKENAIEYRTKTEIKIKADRKPIIRISVRKGITVAKFHLENDLMKKFRRNSAEAKIDVKDTKVNITDVLAFETAKGLIDVAVENNKREKEAAAEARRQHIAAKRRLNR